MCVKLAAGWHFGCIMAAGWPFGCISFCSNIHTFIGNECKLSFSIVGLKFSNLHRHLELMLWWYNNGVLIPIRGFHKLFSNHHKKHTNIYRYYFCIVCFNLLINRLVSCVLVAAPVNHREFSSGLFDCFSDCKSCKLIKL